MEVEFKNPETKPQTEEKQRRCLMCDSTFQSEWAGERICRKCKSTETWRRG